MTKITPNKPANGESNPNPERVLVPQEVAVRGPERAKRSAAAPTDAVGGDVPLVGPSEADPRGETVDDSVMLAQLAALAPSTDIPGGKEIANRGDLDIDLRQLEHQAARIDTERFVAALSDDDAVLQDDLIAVLGTYRTTLQLKQQKAVDALGAAWQPDKIKPVIDELLKNAKIASGVVATEMAASGLMLEPEFTSPGKAPAGGIDIPPDLNAKVADYFMGGSMPLSIDINGLVQAVLRQSYMQTTEQMYDYARRVQFYNNYKKRIRDELNRARKALARVAGDEEEGTLVEPFIHSVIVPDYVGNSQPIIDNSAGLEVYEQLAPLRSEVNGKKAAEEANEREKEVIMAELPEILNYDYSELRGKNPNYYYVRVKGSIRLQGLTAEEIVKIPHVQQMLPDIHSRLADTVNATPNLVAEREVAESHLRDEATGSENVMSTTKDQLKNYMEQMEEKLNSVGGDAQLANVDLQNQLQKQQQTLQMLSNMSKMLHDTIMAIIRKVGG